MTEQNTKIDSSLLSSCSIQLEYIKKRCQQNIELTSLQSRSMMSMLASTMQIIIQNLSPVLNNTQVVQLNTISESTLIELQSKDCCQDINFNNQILRRLQDLQANSSQAKAQICSKLKLQLQSLELKIVEQTNKLQQILESKTNQNVVKIDKNIQTELTMTHEQQPKIELFKVGADQKFKSISIALAAIIEQFGQNGKKKGKGYKITLQISGPLIIDPDLNNPNHNRICALDKDLSWITVKGSQNIIKFIGNLPPNCGNVWYFDKAFTFQKGTKIDATNLYCTNPFSLLTAHHIELQDIHIYNTGNNFVQYNIYICGGKPSFLSLKNCTLNGGSYSVLVNGGYAQFLNCKLNNWTSHALHMGKGLANIKYSDFSKNGQTSQQDILLFSGTVVNQVCSKAKSKLAKNTNNQNGTYWVSGPQQKQGISDGGV